MSNQLPLGTGEPIFQTRKDGLSRVFIQLSENAGCTGGCAYCYIQNVGKRAIPIPPEKMEENLARLTEHPDFSDETLVSLGCDTDPFLEEIASTTIQTLDFFGDRKNPFQIATKFLLPSPVKEVIGDRSVSVPKVVLSTSITTIADAERLEPGAPSPEIRALNLDNEDVHSLAIIKPYRRGTIHELPGFTDLFSRRTPVGVIVGGLIAHSRINSAMGQAFALDPTRTQLPLSDEGHQFSELLQGGLRERGIDIPFWESAAVALRALAHRR